MLSVIMQTHVSQVRQNGWIHGTAHIIHNCEQLPLPVGHFAVLYQHLQVIRWQMGKQMFS